MAWVALDDSIFYNRKVVQCDPGAKLLYVVGLVYCGHQLTDGYIAHEALPLLAGMAGTDLAIAKQNASKLVSIGLWDATEDQWHVPDYLDYNPSKEQVLHKKAVRAAAGKMGGMAKASNRLANAKQTLEQKPSKTVPPSPSPNDDDDERQQALQALQVLGLFNAPMLAKFDDMWPELAGRRDWVGKAITVARDKNASSPAYALKVLANAIHTGKEPGYINGTGNGETPKARPPYNNPAALEKSRRIEEAARALAADGITQDTDHLWILKIDDWIEANYGERP